jgi:nitrate reductase beta subunit
MRDINLGREPDPAIPAAVGMTEEQVYDMYRLLALAKYEDRYVIPSAHAEQAHSLEELATECSLDFEDGPGMGGGGAGRSPSDKGGGGRREGGPFGESSGTPTPVAVENFQLQRERQTADTLAAPDGKSARINLLNWNGQGHPVGLFPAPERKPDADEPTPERNQRQ